MELKNIYLETANLDKERFLELTKGMAFYSKVNFKNKYIELDNLGNGLKWYEAYRQPIFSDLITLDQLEQLLHPSPTYISIPIEDYKRFQEWEAHHNINYDNLKTGSVVMLDYSDEFCSATNAVDYKQPFTIVFYRTPYFILGEGLQNIGNEREYITFAQGKNFAFFSSERDVNYIKKVISY